MIKTIIYLISAGALFCSCVNAPVAAQNRPQDYHRALETACASEVASYCRGIVDIRGRLLACLYRHGPNLSAQCDGMVWGAMESLGKALDRDDAVLRDCDRNSRQYCDTVISGGGNLVACFLAARRVISFNCKKAIYSSWDKGQ
jgi:Cysteine rich repeat